MQVVYEVPKLDHDAMMARKYGQKLEGRNILERRIAWNLFLHLAEAGFTASQLDDSDEVVSVSGAKEAMELLFNLDQADIYFKKGDDEHVVRLILGNGIDMISDWTFAGDDHDGFNAAMEAFNAEACA
jgi:hypothetical protein